MSEINTVTVSSEGLKELGQNIKTIMSGQSALDEAIKALQEKTAKLEDGEKSSILKDELERLKADILELTKKANRPAMPQVELTEEKRAKIKAFFNDVKSAAFGGSKAALQSGAVTGSYLVPTEFLAVLWDMLPKYPSFINETFRLPWGTAGNTRHIPNLLNRPVFQYVGEGAAKSVSNPVFSVLEQTLIKAACICVVTEEMLEDSAIDIEQMLAEIIVPALVDFYNKWLFLGLTGPTPAKEGITNASGILTPTVTTIADLAALKFSVPVQVRSTGKFYVDTSVYISLLSAPKNTSPVAYSYENGVMKIDGSEVVQMDTLLIGAGNAIFGDLKNVIWSPKYELATRFSNMATIVDGDVTHNLFQENKSAFLFETRGDITVYGPAFAKATITGA